MPESEHASGSWLGDLSNEWRRAKTPEKVMIVGAVVGVVGIALYLHKQSAAPNQPGAADTSGLGGIPANFQQGGGGGGTITPTPSPTSPPQAPAPAPVPTPKPLPTPTLPSLPVRPIVQPTTVLSTYGSTNHAPSANVPIIPYKAWTPPPSRTPGTPVYIPPSHVSAPRPGPSGGQGIPYKPPTVAPGNTMQQTIKRLIGLNG